MQKMQQRYMKRKFIRHSDSGQVSGEGWMF